MNLSSDLSKFYFSKYFTKKEVLKKDKISEKIPSEKHHPEVSEKKTNKHIFIKKK